MPVRMLGGVIVQMVDQSIEAKNGCRLISSIESRARWSMTCTLSARPHETAMRTHQQRANEVGGVFGEARREGVVELGDAHKCEVLGRSLEGMMTGDELVEDDAKRPEVGAAPL